MGGLKEQELLDSRAVQNVMTAVLCPVLYLQTYTAIRGIRMLDSCGPRVWRAVYKFRSKMGCLNQALTVLVLYFRPFSLIILVSAMKAVPASLEFDKNIIGCSIRDNCSSHAVVHR